MKRLIILVMAVIISVSGCSKLPEAKTQKKVGYYDILDLLGLKEADVKEKDESGDDVRIVYGENKYDIIMYDDFSRVVCQLGKDNLVMYSDNTVKLSYDQLLNISVEKFLMYADVQQGINYMLEQQGLSGTVDFYTPDMITVTVEDGKIKTAEAIIEAFIESDSKSGRLRFLASFLDGEIIDLKYEVVILNDK